MLVFNNDYSVGCHEKVLEKIISTNPEILGVYGDDKYSNSAREKIKELCDCPTAETWFLYGGTQTNQMAIDLFLQPYEGVVSAATGHVAGHEAGAIEFSGHKVLTVPEHLGKIDAKEVDDYLDTFFTFVQTLCDNGILSEISTYFNEQTSNILNNLENPMFPKEKVSKILSEIITNNPFIPKCYQIMKNKLGETEEVIALSNYFKI